MVRTGAAVVVIALGLTLAGGCQPGGVARRSAAGPDQAAGPADPSLQPLAAPIALYPDPLLAEVLPASTYPVQVAQADQWAAANPSAPPDRVAAEASARQWDSSVAALVHYPSVLHMMAADPTWTTNLGVAFTTEQPELMATLQDLRDQARARGNLATTPEVCVVDDGNDGVCVRPQADVGVPVPTYDPVAVYSQPSVPVVYSDPAPTGPWLNHGMDWRAGTVYDGDWHQGWTPAVGGGWARDPAWTRAPSDFSWARDARAAPLPTVAQGHYAVPKAIGGRQFAPVPVRQTMVTPGGGVGAGRSAEDLVDNAGQTQEPDGPLVVRPTAPTARQQALAKKQQAAAQKAAQAAAAARAARASKGKAKAETDPNS